MEITAYQKFHCEVIPTSKQIKRLREKLKLTQEEFADILWVNKLCVTRWETDKRECKGTALRLINILTQFDLWEKI